jgi:hypothetical protein
VLIESNLKSMAVVRVGADVLEVQEQAGLAIKVAGSDTGKGVGNLGTVNGDHLNALAYLVR